MRVLLVLAMIPLLAACSVFSSSEPSATLVDPQPTETTAGTTDTTGAPAAGTSTDPASVTPTPVAATPTPAANAPVAAKTRIPKRPCWRTCQGTDSAAVALSRTIFP